MEKIIWNKLKDILMSGFFVLLVYMYEDLARREIRMEDSTIIFLLKNRPSEGLLEATNEYGGLVKAIVLKILLNSPEDVEECIADTFVALWKNVNSINLYKGSLKSYLACIARNTAINRYNKLKREAVDYMEDKKHEISSDENIEDALLMRSDIEILQDLLKDMRQPDKEIFFRRYFLFERVKAIASRLGLTEKIVENKLFRGKKKLRKQLTERGVTV